VPTGTLERYVYVKDTSRFPEELVNVHLGRIVLPSEIEGKLVDQKYYGLRRQDIKRMAFQLALINCFETSI
jgi:hypothetical protein